ncbi:peptide deformylase [Paracoccus aminophilus]|uniref:Peptide deformylase n=1 Tax=Paracoccus aminophilus JCM 7686 TaxID=1367847 RepID=S5XW15_PARAH|nr:peptide deformylase [Paracoccus aminophilus]AGT07560.1 peptide deformylase Def2 [Paracoccus aminophilus JCM 7686]
MVEAAGRAPTDLDTTDLSGLAETGQLREILIHPHPVLRQIAAPVGAMEPGALRQLVADMLATMYHAEGRGLAAPQIGVGLRLFVMDHDWKTGTSAPRVLIDPEITFLSGLEVEMTEGCLSIPDLPVVVLRPERLSVTATDLDGRRESRDFAGIEARIIQHEADHLDGRLIVDFLEDPSATRGS